MGKEEVKVVAEMIARAKKAQSVAESYSQEKVDEIVLAMAWAAIKNAGYFAQWAFTETGMGDPQDKFAKLNIKVRGCLRDLKETKTVGIIETDEEKGIIKIAKPVGVVAALTPATNAEITPVLKAMCALKARNAIIFSPHPGSKKCVQKITGSLRAAITALGCPPDLIQCISEPGKDLTRELMAKCDLVVATGGASTVRLAYSSGTPAYGVGAGNAVVVVDETVDIAEAAGKIAQSKTFDLATSCSSENTLLIAEDIYERMLLALVQVGGYLTSPQEKKLLEKIMWHNGVLNREVVARPARKIAKFAGFTIAKEKSFLIVEEDGIGPDYPFSGEKLSVVLAVYETVEKPPVYVYQ